MRSLTAGLGRDATSWLWEAGTSQLQHITLPEPQALTGNVWSCSMGSRGDHADRAPKNEVAGGEVEDMCSHFLKHGPSSGQQCDPQ